MRRAALLLAASLALSGAARAACPEPTTANALMKALNAAQLAYASLDTDGFERASGDADAALGCLGEAISPPVAAQVHRNEAIKAYIADDPARVRSAFRAALTLQPGWRMPEDVLPPGSPLAALYGEAQVLGPGPEETINLPTGLVLVVDGAITQRVPSERPTILQIAAPDGRISGTWYLRVGAPLPDALRNAPPPLPVPPGPGPTVPGGPVDDGQEIASDEDHSWVPLALGAGASGLLAGSSYLLSVRSHASYVSPGEVPYDELASLKRANHAEVLVAGGLGLATLGLGLGAVIVGVW